MAVTDWSTTPASNNAAPPTGAPEGMAPSSVNDVMRQMMADTRTFYDSTQTSLSSHTSSISTLNSSITALSSLTLNSQSTNYTLVIGDANKQILHASGAGSGHTFTIPANASVAFPVGTVLTFVNADSSSVSISISTDTMTYAGTVVAGTRTLSVNGIATALKTSSTSWLIFGVGLS